ncbi:acyltransferase family protein [Actinokineospora sp. NPDC004072]
MTSHLVDDPSTTNRRRDLPALTGMRFIAALMVFLSHVVFPLTPANLMPATPFADDALNMALVDIFYPAADIGVSFFFLVSGFVIFWSTRPGERVTAYWRRRLVKVFPNHIVTWGLAMLLFAAAFTPALGIPSLLLVNAWVMDPNLWGGANNLSWSLNAELLFYLLFPFLAIPVRKIPERKLWLAGGVVVALMALAGAIVMLAVPSEPAMYGDTISLTQFWLLGLFPPMRLFEFVVGMIVARIVLAGRWPRMNIPVILVLFLAGYVVTMLAPTQYKLYPALIPLALLVGSYAAVNLQGKRTLLGSKPMVWLGNVSFGVYMSQFLVLYVLRGAIFGDAEFGVFGGIMLILGLLAVNVLCGWILFTCVERPAMRRWARSRKPAPVPPVAQAKEGDDDKPLQAAA